MLAHFQKNIDAAQRTGLLVGAHVSAAGGVEKAVWNAVRIGAPCFGIFVRSQRQWNPPPTAETSIEAFRQLMNLPSKDTHRPLESNPPFPLPFDPLRHVLPHGSYLINLGSPDDDAREKSYQGFLDELKRCEALGIGMYNFHPGSALSKATPEATEQSLHRVSQLINRAHGETTFVKAVIENSAGGGGTLGVTFEQIGEIVKGVENKERIGVCLDTCHAFAAGYDLSTDEGYAQVMDSFSSLIGLEYLCAIHLNDSKSPLHSRTDRHENLGHGHIGEAAFRRIAQDPRLRGKPMILETPARENGGELEVYTREVAMMYAFAEQSATP
ncbi:AP endonuclease [Gonapodya prolifera JEL478]|uniref:Apurinic-apyrimidinic endonuclease 1 n=1 Tax=Gonapodya prolifera (strain JEL478) TaxID=1344416 RepID=A0A139AHP7_GONPJ|nr:AP endonuclease [Gonapodya prolifera JEL478]|eukprot:KXS16351.1 AP endonuclease [Gonapodya prolifera JEL478]